MTWGTVIPTLSKRTTTKEGEEKKKNHSSFVLIIAGKICINTTIASIYSCEYFESKASWTFLSKFISNRVRYFFEAKMFHGNILISTKVFKGKLLRSRLDSLVTSGEKEIENLTFSHPFQNWAFGYNSLSQKHYKVWVLFQQGMTINLKPQKPSWDGIAVPWPAALVKLIENIWPQRIKMCKDWEARFSLL